MFNKSSNKTELLFNVTKYLELNEIKNFKEESQIMIAYAGREENFIDVKLENIDDNKLYKIINQRINGRPLSKIIKQKGFWKNIFITDENTLDPRADSEIIIENVLNDLSKSNLNDFLFIDICCGTGCLGISILDEINNSYCDFIDISEKAILVCQKNLTKFQLENRSNIFISNLFKNYPLERLHQANFIICNPPYISSSHYFNLDRETLHDPRLALDGGIEGTSYYIEIINYLQNVKFSGDIFFEIDPIISEKLEKFLLEKRLKIVYKKPDYLKLDRLIKITLP
tara:strand:+ start:2657 stop:3511 length:855 start_codon:yes stop_codon:yes gene_type:complete